jgi:bis(5'-nucleosyl)-tetraphosphatase (symmetrical)
VATYAVGDIQGCYDEFARLLEKVRFDTASDRLWIVGDLINRGPDSLGVIRLVRSLGDAAVTVLGNHDLHLLAIRYGGHRVLPSDTFQDVIEAHDSAAVHEWLRHRPLLVCDEGLGYVMTHAGVPHIWSLEDARRYAAEVEAVMQGPDFERFFASMYGNRPDCWSDDLSGMDRWRVITNYLTRMRLVDVSGRLDFSHKGSLATAPRGWYPWYQLRARNPLPVKIVFGHWAAIEGETAEPDVIALDTGCVWGRALTALCFETGKLVSVLARDASR